MKRSLSLCLLVILWSPQLWAQVTISGKIISSANEDLRGVSILLKGNTKGAQTDEQGRFTLVVPQLPAAILISNIGFETREIYLKTRDAGTITLELSTAQADPIVMAPTRRPARSLEAPVSLESFSSRNIRNAAAESYYGVAAYKKGVDITTSSLCFKTISTRGFNGSGSARVNQMVDGMDNQAPGLNFFVGNFAGLTELDVDHVEILPGASSALYGPGGMNGTILISSKNPYDYQGLSVQVKEGINNVDQRQRPDVSSFHDFSMRYAKAFHNGFAFKVSAQYVSATDWLASDSSNYSRNGTVGKVIPGNRNTDPNYDGVNVYGDETSTDIYPILAQVLGPSHPLAEHIQVSRTGYDEKDVIDPITKNVKLSGALHYKFNDRLEAQLMGYWATGNTVYTGNNRYVFKDIKIGQYKLELKSTNWFLRSYTTQEDAGNSYSATVATQFANEAWKRSFDPSNIMGSWYPQFAGAYLQARSAGLDKMTALNRARAFADQGRPAAGSDQFKSIFDQVRKVPIPNGGLFLEKSQLWMTEGQYNFAKWAKYADITIGGNWKKYVLNSQGTLFIDTLKPIVINEAGAYMQVARDLFHKVLSLSFSGRYDKNEDFKGHFTPRATALVHIAKNNNIRLSYQTAYRFPSTQQKYIRLDVGSYTILGGLPWVMDFMNAEKNPVFEIGSNGPSSTPYVYKEFKPENMKSFELGYKGWIADKLLVDAYGYVGNYENFLGRNALVQMATGKVYSTVVNSTTTVKTHGFGLGLDYRFQKTFSAFINAYTDVLTDVPTGFQSYFNTPKYRVNAGFTNSGMGKKNKIGFGVAWHWQEAFDWDGELANGPVPAYSTLDAQVNYQLPKVKTTIKLGGSNVFNKYYKSGFANPEIGGLYYLSIGYNL